MHVHVYIHIPLSLSLYVYIYIYIYILCLFIVCVYIYIYIHIYTHILWHGHLGPPDHVQPLGEKNVASTQSQFPNWGLGVHWGWGCRRCLGLTARFQCQATIGERSSIFCASILFHLILGHPHPHLTYRCIICARPFELYVYSPHPPPTHPHPTHAHHNMSSAKPLHQTNQPVSLPMCMYACQLLLGSPRPTPVHDLLSGLCEHDIASQSHNLLVIYMSKVSVNIIIYIYIYIYNSSVAWY